MVVFTVIELRIIDTEKDVINSEEGLTLTLQTTAVAGDEWILNREEMEKKSQTAIPNGNNLALLVIAKPLNLVAETPGLSPKINNP